MSWCLAERRLKYFNFSLLTEKDTGRQIDREGVKKEKMSYPV